MPRFKSPPQQMFLKFHHQEIVNIHSNRERKIHTMPDSTHQNIVITPHSSSSYLFFTTSSWLSVSRLFVAISQSSISFIERFVSNMFTCHHRTTKIKPQKVFERWSEKKLELLLPRREICANRVMYIYCLFPYHYWPGNIVLPCIWLQ